MGRIDAETKEYVKRPEVFADLFNHLLYDGKPVIEPGKLSEMDTTELALPYGETVTYFPTQKYRDVLKNAVIMEDSKAAYLLILGAENQTDVHYAMPVKNMVYDALNYASQVSDISRHHRVNKDSATNAEYLSGMHRDDRLVPVITLVVYFGQNTWDGPMSIHDMLTTQESGIMQYVPDYRINLISPVSMNDQEIEKFKSDFKQLAKFIQCGKDKNAMKKLVESDEKYKHMDPLTANIANDVTNSNLQLTINKKEEIDMCVAIAGIREDARMEGIAEGIEKGIAEGIAKGKAEGISEGKAEGENLILTLIQKMFAEGRVAEIQRVSEDEEYRMKVMEEFGLK